MPRRGIGCLNVSGVHRMSPWGLGLAVDGDAGGADQMGVIGGEEHYKRYMFVTSCCGLWLA
jgi:hypothetical protein